MRLDPLAKLLWQGDKVKNWLETGERVAPVLVEIAPTGYCNATSAACPWCNFKDRHESLRVDGRILLRALNDMAEFGVKAINWTGGGEPVIYPNFNEFICFAHQKGLEQGLFTNGFVEIPNQEIFKWIRISLTNKGYEVIKKLKVPFGICLNQTENQSTEELRRLCLGARDLGAVYFQIRPALIGFYDAQPKLEVPEYLKEYETGRFKVYTTSYKYEECTRKRDYGKCYGYFFCPSINWRAQLGACLYMMHDERFIFGDLKEDGFSEIWRQIPDYVSVIPECQNCCKNHEINKSLFAAKNVEQINFL